MPNDKIFIFDQVTWFFALENFGSFNFLDAKGI